MNYRSPDTLAEPLGLYSHVATSDGRLAFVAGQVSLAQNGDVVGDGDVGVQLRQVLANIDDALRDVGGSLRDVGAMTTYVVHEDLIGDFYEARARLFPDYFGDGPYPPNTLVVVTRLVDPRFLIEVQAFAVVSHA